MLFVAIFAPPWPCHLPLFILFSRVSFSVWFWFLLLFIGLGGRPTSMEVAHLLGKSIHTKSNFVSIHTINQRSHNPSCLVHASPSFVNAFSYILTTTPWMKHDEEFILEHTGTHFRRTTSVTLSSRSNAIGWNLATISKRDYVRWTRTVFLYAL